MIDFAKAPPVAECRWEETVGKRPHTVWVGEREVGGNIYVRWSVRRKPVPRTLGLKIRDDRNRPRKTAQEKALGIARKIQAALAEGRDPLAQYEKCISEPAQEKPTGNPQGSFVTLDEALDRALRVGSGMYVVADAHTRAMRKSSKLLLQALGPHFSMGDLTAATAETVWRHVLKRARTGNRGPSGYGAAEKAVVLLYRAARWIHERSPNEAPLRQPARNWRSKLREEWVKEFGTRLPDAKTLRFTREEAATLFEKRHLADVRVQLAIELGAELRAGQVGRSMRSDLDLGETGAYGLGTFTVHGRGKKHGEVVHLTPEQRAFVDRCLGSGGHLRELEQAWSSGRIPDYHLWQKGRMHKGVIPLERHLANPGPMDPGSLIDLFKEFEAVAGVTHVHGRDFHGLRRVMTDIAEDYTGDSRELDRLTGHAALGTRSSVYQDRHKDEFREGAAEVRARMRADLQARHRPAKRRGRAALSDQEIRRLREDLAAEGIPLERIAHILSRLDEREAR